jgi:hypothetical protein
MRDFELWFEDLVELAYAESGSIGRLVDRAPFMYEDYFEAGMTPQEALLAEWGV